MLNKNLIFLIFLLTFTSINIFSQNIILEKNVVGLWQESDTLVGSGLQDVYRFFNNHDFIFEVSSYNQLSGFTNFSGKYKIVNDTLYVTITKIKRRIGGKIIIGGEDQDYNWAYSNYKEASISVKYPQTFAIIMCKCNKKGNNMECMQINYVTFFKISSNPEAFK